MKVMYTSGERILTITLEGEGRTDPRKYRAATGDPWTSYTTAKVNQQGGVTQQTNKKRKLKKNKHTTKDEDSNQSEEDDDLM